MSQSIHELILKQQKNRIVAMLTLLITCEFVAIIMFGGSPTGVTEPNEKNGLIEFFFYKTVK